MLITDRVILFTVIHRTFCHISIYLPYSNHVIVKSLNFKSKCVTAFSSHISLSNIYFLMVLSPVYISVILHVFLMRVRACVYV